MASHKLVNLKDEKVQVKTDLNVEEFKYFTSLIQNNIQQSWVDERKLSLIKNNFENFLSDTYKNEFVIAFGLDLCYNISCKKKSLLMIKIDRITFFIFRPKPLDRPRIPRIEQVEIDKQVLADISKSVVLQYHHNLNEEDLKQYEKVQQYLSKILFKYANEYHKNQSDYETIIVLKMKNYINFVFSDGFWQVFLSKKIETYITQNQNEKYLEIGFQPYTHQEESNKPNLKLIMFQKRCSELKFVEKIWLKKREILSFLLLFLVFIIFVNCKESKTDDEGRNLITQKICENKQEYLALCALGFMALIGQRLIQKQAEKVKSREKMLKKQQ